MLSSKAMAIAAYASERTKDTFYVRAEYPIAVKRLQIAIDQAMEYGLLGDHIFDTDFSFRFKASVSVQELFVCGEKQL
jgi:NADP-reducing hydrogenase subunit HndC